MRWPWKKEAVNSSPFTSEEMVSSGSDGHDLASYGDSSQRDFSFYWFFLVFWLTVIATVLISWKMIL